MRTKIEQLSPSEFNHFSHVNNRREAAMCGPCDLPMEEATQIFVAFWAFQQEIAERYELDCEEGWEVDPIDGGIYEAVE